MISDILSQSASAIQELYLQNPDYDEVYTGEIRARIVRVVHEMELVRIDLDNPNYQPNRI